MNTYLPEGIQMLPDEALLDCYLKAVELELDRDFITLLRDEITRRGTIREKQMQIFIPARINEAKTC